MPSQHRCKFCDAKIKRKRFENTNAYLGRDYCQKPKCMARGREEQLSIIYAKEKDDPSQRHAVAFITRALFIYRWGLEPMEAMDRFGKEASDDWLRVFSDVKEGKCMQVRITVEVYDNEENSVAEQVASTRFHLPNQLSEELARLMADNAANAAHEYLIEALYGNAD